MMEESTNSVHRCNYIDLMEKNYMLHLSNRIDELRKLLFWRKKIIMNRRINIDESCLRQKVLVKKSVKLLFWRKKITMNRNI